MPRLDAAKRNRRLRWHTLTTRRPRFMRRDPRVRLPRLPARPLATSSRATQTGPTHSLRRLDFKVWKWHIRIALNKEGRILKWYCKTGKYGWSWFKVDRVR